MTEDLSQSHKLILRKVANFEGNVTSSGLLDDVAAYQSRNGLANALRNLAQDGYLDRERVGNKHEYWLADKGKKFIRNLRKRERDRQEKSEDIFDFEDGVDEFVRFFEDEKYGFSEIEAVGAGRRFVYLDYQDLEKFNVELADELLRDPDSVLQACKEAVNSLPEMPDVKGQVNIRVSNVSDIETQSISELSSKDVNKLVTVEGVIQSASKPKAVLVNAICECTQCGERYSKNQEGNKKLKTPYKCASCENRKFEVLREEYDTIRYVRVKEKPDQKSRNKIVAVLQGAIAEDESKSLNEIGSGVRITGYLKTYKQKKSADSYDFRLHANNLEVEETKWEIEDISSDEKQRFQEISDREDTFDYLSKSLAYEEIKHNKLLKKAFMVWLAGRTRDFGNLHVLCIGDPGTAKSNLASYVQENFGKVIRSVATGATEVGLTASVTKDEVTGEWTAEAGSIPMADGGFHITDEIDELSQDHYSAFNEALSDQSVSITKANIHTEISADVAEFSLGNPTDYTFNDFEDKYKQIPVKKDDLISRFGLMLAVENNGSDSSDEIRKERETVDHVLKRSNNPDFSDHDYVSPQVLSKYVYFAQRIYPRLTDEAMNMIKSRYMDLFSAQDAEDNFIKIRHVEAIAAMSKGIARLNLEDQVQTDHVSQAFSLFQECYASIDFKIGADDIDSLEGQNNKRMKQLREAVPKEEPVEVGEVVNKVNLPENQAERTIQKLKNKGEFFEPENGMVQKL